MLTALIFYYIVMACTSTSSLRENYLQKISEIAPAPLHKTYFVFLVDGLGYHNFIDYQKNMPSTVVYFKPKVGENFFPALSVLPSLTFPNLASLLTGRKVFEHDVVGNKMLLSDGNAESEVVNWEDPLSAAKLNKKLSSSMIFNSLAKEGRANVSLAYYFSEGSTAHLHKDLHLAKQYYDQDYLKMDRQTLFSLEKFLKEVPQSQWPELVFVHLVSFDFASHDFGPNSSYVQKKLLMLDLQLQRIYQLLLAAEKEAGNVVSLITSDHGFVETSDYFDLDGFVNFTGSKAQVLAQSRVAAVHFNKELSEDAVNALIKTSSNDKRISLITQKSIKGFNLIINGAYYSFKYVQEPCKSYTYALTLRGDKFCPEDAEAQLVVQGAPHIVEQISAYHRSLQSADALFFAAPGVNFEPKQRGGHGGVSLYEMQPLVILRNAKLQNATDHFHIENLLDFIVAP